MNIIEVHKKIRKTYNQIAGKYHDAFHDEMENKPFDRQYVDKFVKDLDNKAIICDAGCGPSAQLAKYLNHKGYNVFGIDISEKCIEMAQENNPGMVFYRTDFLDWDIRDHPIDAIIAYYSIIFSPKKDIDRIMQSFFGNLKPGGKLLLTLKEGNFEGEVKEVLQTEVDSYFAEYSEDEIRIILERNGFRIDNITSRVPYETEIQTTRIYCTAKKHA